VVTAFDSGPYDGLVTAFDSGAYDGCRGLVRVGELGLVDVEPLALALASVETESPAARFERSGWVRRNFRY
jgi:hypothetical protein